MDFPVAEHTAAEGSSFMRSRSVGASTPRSTSPTCCGGLYVAHHYTRYLGDPSGGQAIGRILDRTFDLCGNGVAFYDFVAVPKPKPYKDRYRARLDALPLTAVEKDRVVPEVRVAFGLNQALFNQLRADLPGYLTGSEPAMVASSAAAHPGRIRS